MDHMIHCKPDHRPRRTHLEIGLVLTPIYSSTELLGLGTIHSGTYVSNCSFHRNSGAKPCGSTAHGKVQQAALP